MRRKEKINMNTIHLQARNTITAAYASTGIDISPSTYGFNTGGFSGNNPGGNLKLCVCLYGLDAGDSAQITIESSTNAFTNYQQHAASWVAPGPIGATSPAGDIGQGEGKSTGFFQNPQYFKVGWWDQAISQIPWGTADAVLRVNVASLTGTNRHLTYEAWFNY